MPLSYIVNNLTRGVSLKKTKDHHVVVVGGGFGGLYATQKLGNRKGISVTLIDRRNFHLFQPLLYQVATGGLSPGDIASPLRAVLNRFRNVRVLQATVTGINAPEQTISLGEDIIKYDSLVIATGAHHHYFGNDQWASNAPGLKTIEDALEMRRRIFRAFEAAEREDDPGKKRSLMTFVIVGGGPTGVELAGALGELANFTLKNDFRNLDPRNTRILLLEGGAKILAAYPDKLSNKASSSLKKLGVDVRTETLVTAIADGQVRMKHGESEEIIEAETVLWAAGVKSSSLSKALVETTGAGTDRSGRIVVDPFLNVGDFANIYVIGDLAHFAHQGDDALPGVAPVAMQQGRHVARLIRDRLRGKEGSAFKYTNKGNLAVIGRNAAIADVGPFKMSGWFAWLIWIFVHIAYLIEFDSRVLVLFQWASNYFTRKRGARLITNEKTV